MADTVSTLRPNELLDPLVTWASGPGPVVALSDDNSATYAYPSPDVVGAPSSILKLGLTSITLPDHALFKYVQVWLDIVMAGSLVSGDRIDVTATLYSPLGDKRLPPQQFRVTFPGLGRYTLLPYASWPDGTAFTSDDFETGMELHLYAETDNALTLSQLRFREAGVDVVYNRAPTVTIGNYVGTGSQRAEFTFSDPEDDLQERWEYRVYATPTAGWPSGTTTDDVVDALEESDQIPIYEEVVVSDYTRTGVAMPGQGTFRAFLRAADENSAGRFGGWTYVAFTISNHNGDDPETPTVVVETDEDNARIRLRIGSTPNAVHLTPEQYDVQRSADGGVTWTTVVGSPFLRQAATTIVYDRFCPREQALSYRVRSRRLDTTSFYPVGYPEGDTFFSPWVTSLTVALTSDGNSWLQAADDTDGSLDLAFTQVGTLFDLESSEDQSVFYAESREDPIIFGGTVHLRVGTLTLVLTDDLQWEQFQQLRALRGKLLLRTLYGDGPLVDVWVRLGQTLREQMVGGYRMMDVGQLREVTVSVAEVTAPSAAN